MYLMYVMKMLTAALLYFAGKEGYEGAKDGEITNASLTETTGVAVRGRTIFFGELVSDTKQQSDRESLADELNIIKSILNSFGVLSDKEGRAKEIKTQAVKARK